LLPITRLKEFSIYLDLELGKHGVHADSAAVTRKHHAADDRLVELGALPASVCL